MTKSMKITAVALLAAAFCAPAFAQDASEKPDEIVLTRADGSVTTSTGGDYTSANPGQKLVNGQFLQLGAGAKAQVTYYYYSDDGKRRRECVENYAGQETYRIDDSCTMAAAWTSNGRPGMAAAVIVGAGLIGAAILNSADDVPVGPLSTGPNGGIRHF